MQEEQIARVLIAAAVIVLLVLRALSPIARLMFGVRRDTRPRRR